MWPQLFGLTNAVALVAWALLIFGPRAPLLPVVRHAGVGLLCAAYVALVATALAGGFGPPTGPAPDFTSIAGVRAIFGTDGGVVAGWTHYLALDLIAGCWIAEEADRRGFGRLVQAPVLFLTFIAGPAGLLLWFLLSRGRATAHLPR